METLLTNLARIERELQDLKDRLHCKPACIYHAYRNYTVSFAIASLEAMSQNSPNHQERISSLLKEFRGIGYA
ncbi:MAG: hypothetical protein U9R46_13785 [Bacteroidota bacterium]|nr:hypothetical protein [Bacteroidota bacterium]